ncbi:hypothetical protein ACFQ0B_75895 [Nonomuraea thailandensis]
MTLLLAVRRQRHQELAAAHTTHDATERRVTELYTKAADQLGSDKASVHLAGLHALERLAQDTPELRQTIVDVICADLRMPFAKPPDPNAADEPAVPSAAIAGVVASSVGRDPHEERQVRLTAQRILADHLRYQDLPVRRWWQRRRADPNTHHWPDVLLDLNDAVLEDFETASVPRGRRSVLRGPLLATPCFSRRPYGHRRVLQRKRPPRRLLWYARRHRFLLQWTHVHLPRWTLETLTANRFTCSWCQPWHREVWAARGKTNGSLRSATTPDSSRSRNGPRKQATGPICTPGSLTTAPRTPRWPSTGKVTAAATSASTTSGTPVINWPPREDAATGHLM